MHQEERNAKRSERNSLSNFSKTDLHLVVTEFFQERMPNICSSYYKSSRGKESKPIRL